MWEAKPGAKVVCINATSVESYLTKGTIYVIEEVLPGWQSMFHKGPRDCVHLVGVRTDPTMIAILGRIPFLLSRFRPLVRDETMDKLRAILDEPNKLIGEIKKVKQDA